MEIPAALDQLERWAPVDGYLFGSLSIADISVASYFRTASFVRYMIDADRWPRTAALVARVQALPPFQKLAKLEEVVLRVPFAQHRDALAAAGAPLTADTMATLTPRKGVPRFA